MGLMQEALVERFTSSNNTLDYTISDLTPEQLHHHVEGSTLGTPASIYFHVAWVQDLVINHMLRREAPLFDTEGWGDRLPGVEPHRGPSSIEWATRVRIDNVEEAKAYAGRVRANTLDYVASLSDDDLAQDVNYFTGPTRLVNVLTGLIWETANHTGEIAALRGLAGLKGLPY